MTTSIRSEATQSVIVVNGVDVMTISATGDVAVKGNVTAYSTSVVTAASSEPSLAEQIDALEARLTAIGA